MAVLNRTLDASEQRIIFQTNLGAIATGVTSIAAVVPFPCTIDYGQIVANGLSGAPTYALSVNRFITGTGFTNITLATGTSNTPPDYGVSGIGGSGIVMVAAGSTLRNLLANDQLILLSGVANTAAKSLSVSVALKPVADLRVDFGFFV